MCVCVRACVRVCVYIVCVCVSVCVGVCIQCVCVYRDPVAAHPLLPLAELGHPVEDGVERADHQRRPEPQAARLQHGVEERHHLEEDRERHRERHMEGRTGTWEWNSTIQ